MSTDNSAPQDSGALGQRVTAVERQVESLTSALRATRLTRTLLLLGFVALILIAVGLFGSLGKRMASEGYQKELASKAQLHFDNNKDAYLGQIRQLMDESTPIIKTAFLERLEQDKPRYTEALNVQREALLENVKARLELQINARHEGTLARFEQVLIEEFPAAADEEVRVRMMENLRVAVESLVKQYYVDAFQDELQSMYATWDTFPVADAPGADDPPLEDQLIGALLDLMVMKAASGSSLALLEDEPQYDETPLPAEPVTETTAEPATEQPADASAGGDGNSPNEEAPAAPGSE